MAALGQKLSGSALVEVLVRVPLASHAQARACCRDFLAILTSETFARNRVVSGYGPEVCICHSSSSGVFKGALRLLKAFLEPRPGIENIRFETEGVHKGEKVYKFAQLRVGGPQVPPGPMGRKLRLERVDPRGASRCLRDAYWAVMRSVYDGSPIPPAARILVIGNREEASDGQSSMALAVVWTGSEGGVVKSSYASEWPDCSITACGGVPERDMRTALASILQPAMKKLRSFGELLHAFEDGLNSMEESSSWQDEWDYDIYGDGEDDRQDESGEESAEMSEEDSIDPEDLELFTFDAPARTDDTWHFGETSLCLQPHVVASSASAR